MNVVVTGANGFIGQHLVKRLTKDGHKITTIDHTFLVDYPDKLDEIIKEANPDWIFHLAAFGNMAHQKDEFEIIEANIAGTFNLLQATRNIDYKAFVNVSSSSVLLPHQTIYSATKMGAEYLCKAYMDEYNKPIVTVRPASVFGIGEAGFRFIPTVFRSCLENEPMILAPDATHDWILVDDLVESMVWIAITDNEKQTYNIASGIKTTNRAVVSLIEQITGKNANIGEEKQLRSFDTNDWSIQSDVVLNHSLRYGLEQYYEYITGENTLS